MFGPPARRPPAQAGVPRTIDDVAGEDRVDERDDVADGQRERERHLVVKACPIEIPPPGGAAVDRQRDEDVGDRFQRHITVRSGGTDRGYQRLRVDGY